MIRREVIKKTMKSIYSENIAKNGNGCIIKMTTIYIEKEKILWG